VGSEPEALKSTRGAFIGWTIAALYFFYQYVLRSAPSVMMPQLSDAFGMSTLSVASIVGLFYYGYAPFSLIAGAGMDWLGPRRVMPISAAVVGLGVILFATGNSELASVGRFLQGAGGAFAPVGAIYIASKKFPPSQVATLIGATQMFGMAGGAAGQFAVGPLMSSGVSWDRFWFALGISGLFMGALLFVLLPREETTKTIDAPLRITVRACLTVFKNPQSILCGLIAGLLFIPTTIFDMVWGVRYLQEAHGLDYGSAVMRSATVPLGWIIGSPLLGFISDRLGRRKPVIIGGGILLLLCLSWALFGGAGVFPPYVIGLVAGLSSGAAMIPNVVIKEANPAELGGTAIGVLNFLNFTFSAILGPVFAWLLQLVSEGNAQMELQHYQIAFAPMLLGVMVAIILTLWLKETGPSGISARKAQES
jgi:MFS family permease